jgi:hypothetical protein
MKKFKENSDKYEQKLDLELQHAITECEMLLCEQEIKSADSSYHFENIQFEERLNYYSLDYDYFINNQIWSVRKMLPDEFYDQKNIVMYCYLYTFISKSADYYSELYSMKKAEIAKEVIDYIKRHDYWINIDVVLKTYLENLDLPENHAAIIDDYNKWTSILP